MKTAVEYGENRKSNFHIVIAVNILVATQIRSRGEKICYRQVSRQKMW